MGTKKGSKSRTLAGSIGTHTRPVFGWTAEARTTITGNTPTTTLTLAAREESGDGGWLVCPRLHVPRKGVDELHVCTRGQGIKTGFLFKTWRMINMAVQNRKQGGGGYAVIPSLEYHDAHGCKTRAKIRYKKDGKWMIDGRWGASPSEQHFRGGKISLGILAERASSSTPAWRRTYWEHIVHVPLVRL